MTFPPLINDRILRVAKGQPVDKTPVWIMRQAGRYLPEFRATRLQHDFFTICQTPELACEVTLQPIRRYQPLFDASIIFSDILVIPQALGMVVEMVPQKGPHFPDPLNTPADITTKLHQSVNVYEKLGYVFEAISCTRKALDGKVPLYGFTGAPWTLMAYMIEGGGSKTFSKAKKWLVQHPEASHQLLSLITNVIVDYLVGQIKAGAQLLQVFDSWAGELSPRHFREFSLTYLARICDQVKQKCRETGLETVPMVVFAKSAHHSLSDIVHHTDYDVIGLDWSMDIRSAKKQVREALMTAQNKRFISLQGNMDPIFLHAPAGVIRKETERIIGEFLLEEDGKTVTTDLGYICNLGHGIQPDVDPENVQVFLESVDIVSRKILSSQ